VSRRNFRYARDHNHLSMAPTKRSQVDKARQFVTGGAVFREDSDDELGYEDRQWE
jgi:origin recognition complex subunit 1